MSGEGRKTILAQGAEYVEAGEALSPWWRDPDRLLARVMALAESDPKMRRLLRAKVGKLARHDLPFQFQAHHEKENRHQTIVDPVMQIVFQVSISVKYES